MDKHTYLEIFLKTLAIILTIITIYLIILKLIGKTPNLSQINLSLIGILIVLIANIYHTFYYRFGRFQGKVEEFMETTKNSFRKIKEDTDLIKKKL